LVRLQEIEEGELFIMLVSDITRIKELEQQSKKIMSMFFSSVAHELRTPLNSIIPMSKKLRQHVTSVEGLKTLDVIINCTTHLSYVAEDALDYSRIENNRF
jgi:signal transduction histidine kinase